jgi:hypothetical protein
MGVSKPESASYHSMQLNLRRLSGLVVLGLSAIYFVFSSAEPLFAEQETPEPRVALASVSDLPDSPGVTLGLSYSSSLHAPSSGQPAQTGQAQPPKNEPQQTKRIAGIMPNFNAVSADTKLPPQTPKQKFIIAARNSFDYSSFILAGIQAGFNMGTNSYPEFGQGAQGYGKYYYHVLLDTADANFMVAGLFPVIFHQDNRFYTLGHGSPGKRALYAASRVLITRQDSGRQAFNASEIIGAGAAQGVATLYYPEAYRTWTKVGQKWLTAVIIDSANYTFKEFWPDIHQKVFERNKQP